MVGSTALQSSPEVSAIRCTSSAVSSGTEASSNRLPLKCRMLSRPNSPPLAMASKSWPRKRPNFAGSPPAFSTMRVKIMSGSRPMSSANRQKTTRSRKWATCAESRPRWRMDSAMPANRSAASWVMTSLVLPGFSFSGSKKTARRISRLRGSASSVEPDFVVAGAVSVKLVRMTMRSRSQTTSSGGFSRASW